MGIIGESLKEDESRYPVHSKHIGMISKYADNLMFDLFYPNIDNFELSIKLDYRFNVMKKCKYIVLLKPTVEDLKCLKKGQVVIGWNHLAQNKSLTEVAVRNKLTMISMEKMFDRRGHVFKKNNELAGYAALYHALLCTSTILKYANRSKKVAVIGYGATGLGAAKLAKQLGGDVIVFSKRPPQNIENKIKGVRYCQYESLDYKRLKSFDVIINCILQDISNPQMFLSIDDAYRLKKGTLIVDVSCDRGMGFEFAEPTTIQKPLLEVGNVIYYSVDHTPTLFYAVASEEISKALTPLLKYILKNGTYRGNKILEGAVELEGGRVC